MTTEISSKFFLSPDEDQYKIYLELKLHYFFPVCCHYRYLGEAHFLKDIYII